MTENVSPEMVERMIEVLRGYVAGSCATAYGPDENRSVYAEAAAIVAELPAPIDPDLLEARRLAEPWLVYDSPNLINDGLYDKRPAVVALLAAIKRGRTLATQGDR